MKIKTKDFSKYAWSSRLTAPTIKLDLVIKCRELPKKDLLSQADAFCVLWQVPNGYNPNTTSVNANKKGGRSGRNETLMLMPSTLPGRQENERGRTEVARANVNPTFKHSFRLEYNIHEEQTYVIRVYDEDLKTHADLTEHDYLGGCVFTLGQLMGAKGCTIAKRLGRGNGYMVIVGEEIIETREVLEFRFSCQDLIKQQSVIDQSKVLDKSNPYFRLERLNRDDQTWEVIWKSEVIKDSLCPTWQVARLPLQLLCNDDQSNPLKITIWDYEKHSKEHDHMGFVESTVSELVEKAKEGIPVFMVMREKRKFFGGSKLKRVGLFKVLKASVLNIPSILQYLSGGCSLDVMVAIDCSTANKENTSEKSLHHSASHWLNDYQAGIQKLGAVVENFARGRHSSIWGFGAKVQGKPEQCYCMAENICTAKELLTAYDANIVENANFELGGPAELKPVVTTCMFRAIRASQKRQCYTILCVFTAGDIVDLQEAMDSICTAAEDAPLSIVIIGVGNRDFSAIEKFVAGQEFGKFRDSRGVPIARNIVHFVSFKQFSGTASDVIAEGLKDIPEHFVNYFVNNGTKPLPPIPAPDFIEAEQRNNLKKSRKNRREPNTTNLDNPSRHRST